MRSWPPSVPLRQRNTDELLDSRIFKRTEVQRSLTDVARINSFLGATQPFYKSIWRLIQAAQLKRVTILDVGCGNGDAARKLLARGREYGVNIQILALDISPLHLSIARQESTRRTQALALENKALVEHWSHKPMQEIEFVQADAFALPLRDQSIDIVTSTLFLHHFRPPQIQDLLREFSRVARVGWVMNDCTRDAVALWSFRLLRPYLAQSFITRFDAISSIRRAYTPDEMREIVAPIGGAHVEDLFPYRLQVEWKKDQ